MTEQQWLTTDSVRVMVDCVRARQNAARTKVGKRRLRLFACSCLRRVEHLMDVPILREPIALAERYADQQATRQDMIDCSLTILSYYRAPWFRPGVHPLLCNALYCAVEPRRAIVAYAPVTATYAQLAVRHAHASQGAEQAREASQREGRAQADLMREVFGNPFRPLAKRRFPAEVRSLAQASYEGEAGTFPILADALQDLGEEAAAAHCRRQGHVKGCHVLDWVLGKA
jgi:hypothetical protein